MPLVLGTDSSTQSTKIELRDVDDGRLIASGHAPHPPTAPPRSEQHPKAWWDAMASARAQLPERPAAIGVAAQQHGLVAFDDRNETIRPAKLWNDTESAPDAKWLLTQRDAAYWAVACGSVPVASLTITKLSWLRRCEPENFARLTRVLLPHDWLTWKLTGEFVTDRGDASGTGYWSPVEQRWRPDLLEIVSRDVDWPSALPRVLEPAVVAGEHDGAIVAPGTGDNMAAALGLGLRPGDVGISLGTSGTVFGVSDTPTADASGAVAGFADATGRYLPLVCTLNATKVTDAFMRFLGVDRATLEAMALRAQPGASGVTLVPYFDGERTPNRPNARGQLRNLNLTTTKEDLARAAFEGVTCSLLEALDALRAAGVDIDGQVFLVGGGAQSPAYQRVFADLLQRPMTVPDGAANQVATGACLQAAMALTGADPTDIADAWGVRSGAVIEPNPAIDAEPIRAAYQEAVVEGRR